MHAPSRSTPPTVLFLPCAAGVEEVLRAEVLRITGLPEASVTQQRGGVLVDVGSHALWAAIMRLNLHSRLAQRVLVRMGHAPYRAEADLYASAHAVPWERWFTVRQSIKVEVTAQHSPLKSLNFAALTIKDAVCDAFRERAGGIRPNVDTRNPDVRIFAHLTADHCTLYLDTSGEPLFKRGWREDKGDAPLKETLAAAMLAASGWTAAAEAARLAGQAAPPLYDPCCGSGTICIEAAQILAGLPPGGNRAFAFQRMLGYPSDDWIAIKSEASRGRMEPSIRIFGSDVSHRMVDFAQRNAQRAGVAQWLELRGGDALQRLPPTGQAGVMLLNPPYGERIAVAGVAGGERHAAAGVTAGRSTLRLGAAPPPAFTPGAREQALVEGGGEFFTRLATHWKSHYAGWTAWLLTPDLKLPGKLRMKETRRVPMWNGPIECRLFRFDISARRAPNAVTAGPEPAAPSA